MRDLRERDDTAGRKLGLFALAGTLSVAAIISAGVLSGGTRTAEAVEPDPLAELALTSADPKDPSANASSNKPKIDPAAGALAADLSFPDVLLGEASSVERAHDRRDGARLPRSLRANASDIPASTLAGDETERLQRAALHDPQLAAAMPERTGAVAPAGSEGAFTLQVVSFKTRDAGEQFVNALRARGHRAFLSQTELPGRGRSFRARVGPFTTRREALAYQKSFEATERMHGILVAGSGN